MNTRLAALALVVAAGSVILMTGCSSNPAAGKPSLIFSSPEKEAQIGAALHQQQLPFALQDAALQSYVNEIGQKLARVSDQPELTWTFTVLDQDMVNAFAAPGGYIYITRGLLGLMTSEAQMAAVLGHEIGHVTARHYGRGDAQRKVTGVLATVAAWAAGVPGAGLASDYLGEALSKGYGRGLELEADQLGALYAARAGYSPESMIEVIEVLRAHSAFEQTRAAREGRQVNQHHGLFATHPDHEKRLREVVDDAHKLARNSDVDNRFTFLHYTDGMIFGTNLTGRLEDTGEILHAGLNVAVRPPPGWKAHLDRDFVQINADKADGALQVVRLPSDIRKHPRTLLIEYIGEDVKLTREEDVNISGHPGFTAVGLRAPSPFGARAVRYGVVYIGRDAFILSGAAEPISEPYLYDEHFMRAFESLRRLTGTERRASAYATIRVRRADASTTVATLVEASRRRKYVEDEIRLINGLYPDGEPEPGQYVKILQ